MRILGKEYTSAERLNLRLVIGLYRTYFGINRSTQKLVSTYDLTLPQFGVLEALYHLGNMTIGDLINKTLSTSGNMTVVIRNLEQDGLITRCAHPTDGRANILQLTERGRQLIEAVFPEHLNDLDTQLANLSKEEKQTLVRLFKKLRG